MRALHYIGVWFLLSAAANAQGTFVYDQQSADENHILEGGTGLGLQPIGQSFTPSLDAVGFVRLYMYGSISGTFVVNLRSDSVTGTILGTSSPVTLTASGTANFLFPTPISVAPGTAYYLQPVVQSSLAGWGTLLAAYNYPSGTAFVSGVADPTRDLWFREGIVVPEPSSSALLLLGGGFLLWGRRIRQR